jgi:hypothetical protein
MLEPPADCFAIISQRPLHYDAAGFDTISERNAIYASIKCSRQYRTPNSSIAGTLLILAIEFARVT